MITMTYAQNQAWRKLINRRQIPLCLSEGYILENTANMDKFGSWRFNIVRVCAGMNIKIDVALESQGQQPRLFVLDIQGDEIR